MTTAGAVCVEEFFLRRPVLLAPLAIAGACAGLAAWAQARGAFVGRPGWPRLRRAALAVTAVVAVVVVAASWVGSRLPGSYDLGALAAHDAGSENTSWSVNGLVYPRMPMFMVAEGDLVRVIIINRPLVDHPIHLHGHHMQVLERGTTRVTGSPWSSDTLNVAQRERYVVVFRADNPGVWMDHCHNLQHAAQGFVMHVGYEGVSTPFRIGRDAATSPSDARRGTGGPEVALVARWSRHVGARARRHQVRPRPTRRDHHGDHDDRRHAGTQGTSPRQSQPDSGLKRASPINGARRRHDHCVRAREPDPRGPR